MSKKILNFLLYFIFIGLWAGSLLTIALLSENQGVKIALGVLMSLSCIGFAVCWQFYRHSQRCVQRLHLTTIIYNALTNYQEIHLFDESGKTLFSTHSHLYPHKKEFLRRLMLRMQASPESARFKKWVEEHYPGETLLISGANGLGQGQRRWIATVIPVDPLAAKGKHLLLTTLTEVTHYLEGYQNLKDNYQRLEAFLDHAPLGIF